MSRSPSGLLHGLPILTGGAARQGSPAQDCLTEYSFMAEIGGELRTLGAEFEDDHEAFQHAISILSLFDQATAVQVKRRDHRGLWAVIRVVERAHRALLSSEIGHA
jgi:hypothetical protein